MVATFLAMLELIKANKIKVGDESEDPDVIQTGEINENELISEFGGEENA